MSEQLQQMIIRISGIEKKVASNGSIFYNIKDENNKTYKLWQNIKDGSLSKAYQGLKALPNEGLGQVVDIAVEMQSGTYEGKSITYRTIKAFGPFLKENAPTRQIEAKNDKLEAIYQEILAVKSLLLKDRSIPSKNEVPIITISEGADEPPIPEIEEQIELKNLNF